MRRLILTCLVSLVPLGIAATPALAETETLQPWWHFRTSTRPSNIQPGTATDEVQQVTLAKGVESYELVGSGAGLFGRPVVEGARARVQEFTSGESAAEIEATLESEEMYGSGDVHVTPATTAQQEKEGVISYDVTFVGKLTDLPVEPIHVNAARKEGMGTEEGEQETAVGVKPLALGRPDGEIVLSAANVGDANVNPCTEVAAGTGKYTNSVCSEEGAGGVGDFEVTRPVTIKDDLPKGLQVVAIEASSNETVETLHFGSNTEPLECSPVTVSCEFNGKPPPLLDGETTKVETLRANYPKFVAPFETIQVAVAVNVEPGKKIEGASTAQITGGGAPAASFERPLSESSSSSPFGLSTYEMSAEEPGGAPDTQAGSHPFQLTTTAEFNLTTQPSAVGSAKDLHFNLPPGALGDPSAIPRCTLAQFTTPGPEKATENLCPNDTVVGVIIVFFKVIVSSGEPELSRTVSPVFNVEPAPGEPARLGFISEAQPVLLNTAVRTGGDYGVTVSPTNITQQIEFLSNELTIWGVPGAQAHDLARGKPCLKARVLEEEGEPGFGLGCTPVVEPHPPAFFTLPTSCTGQQLQSSVEGDSWEEPHNLFAPFYTTVPMVTLAGCNHLPFLPSIKVTPDSEQASKPTGLNVDVHVNQSSILNPEGLAQSAVKDIEVTLPAGMTLNPSAADGLEGCSANTADRPEGHLGVPGNQIGYTGSQEFKDQPGVSIPTFTPYFPGTVDAEGGGYKEALQPGQNFCPNASKIAEATIHTPLLPSNQPVKGFVYLAAPQNFAGFPQENPFNTHVAMYIVAEDPISGSLVKLPGKVELCLSAGEVIDGRVCEAAGQINSLFEDEPQLPFEDAELHFFGGERAPLASPTHCGSYTTNATYTPWSGGSPVSASSTFQITSGPNGSPCPGASLPFNASLESGTTSNNAGGFSALSTTLSRPDGDQSIQSVTLHYPAGLSGLLSGVELCPEPQANAGTCGPNSQIGETIVSVGVGGDPFTVTGGKAYITGPYNGTGSCAVGTTGCAPFGLSIVNPAKAGPFDLQEGRPVIVRAKIEVNPITAALTITTDPSGAHAIPNIIEGFPLQIQHVNVLVNRPGFTFNPTSCSRMEVSGTIQSAEGASSAVSDPFQATNCQALKFTPKFTVSTSGKTSKANGADLVTKVTEPSEPFGSQANIAKVKVELPLQLPSRLTTLQKACTAAQFEANPAGCPPASFIGHAVVHTPLVPVPLEGPAIFVSHGNESFPSLTMVLQGYGVTIDLVGATFISKSGITSTTFKTIPDQPFSTFELALHNGPYSALAANGNLCAPTTTKTVKKKVTVRVKGRKKTETRKVKEAVATSLVMPNEFVAQNGAVIRQNTTIAVTGCGKAAVHKAKKAKGHEKGGKKK
jgi:hypothetical protein